MEIVQRSFASGEISPDLQRRSDYVAYQNGLRTLRNMIVRKQTGVQERPGTKFIHFTKLPDKKVRLIPFEYAFNDSLIVEVGEGYYRYHTESTYGGLVTEAAEIIDTVVGGVNPLVTTNTNHDYLVNDEIILSLEFNNETFDKIQAIITSVPNTDEFTFDLKHPSGPIDITNLGTFTSGTAAKVYENINIFTEDDLFDIRFEQSGNILTLVHPRIGIVDLERVSNNVWIPAAQYLQPASLRPSGVNIFIDNPPNTNTGTYSYGYLVTYVDSKGIESFGRYSTIDTVNKVGDAGNTRLNISIDPAGSESTSSLKSVNLYRIEFPFILPASNQYTDNLGLPDPSLLANIAFVTSIDVDASVPLGTPFLTIIDRGTFIADFDRKPPTSTFIYGPVFGQTWNGTVFGPDLDNYHPTAVAISKERQVFAGSNLEPNTIWGSAISRYDNMVERFTNLIATDAVKYTQSSGKMGLIKHLLDFKRLLVFTDLKEMMYKGSDEYGTLDATQLPNPETLSNHGISNVRPLVVDTSVLFVQARGNQIRDLFFSDKTDNDGGNEVSLQSAHLIEDYQVIDWAYQKTQHPIAWIVRSDGQLLSLTYNRAQQVTGWARHDLYNANVESVACIGEGVTDSLYLSVLREDTGGFRSVEKLETFEYKTIKTMKLTDCHKIIDGMNTNPSSTIQINVITDYNFGSDLTLNSANPIFNTSSVGKYYFVYYGDDVIRLEVISFSTANAVVVRANKNVPVFLQAATTSNWGLGTTTIKGMYHLEGKEVSVLADSLTASSPLNPDYATLTVTNGAITLDSPAVFVQVGLPYICDFETISFEANSRTEAMGDKTIQIKYANVEAKDTAYFFAGVVDPQDDTLTGMTEVKVREFEGYDDPLVLRTGLAEVAVENKFDIGGRVFIRQVDPHPLRILAVYPNFNSGF